MKTKGIATAAMAALALSGVFAAGAQARLSADVFPPYAGKKPLTYCVETKADAAFMASQPQDRESQRRAAQQLTPSQCLTISVSYEEVEGVLEAMSPCTLREQQAHQDEIGAGREIIEKCLAELPPGTVSKVKGKKQKARHGKRVPQAKVALAQ